MYKQPIKYKLSDYKNIILSKHDWEHDRSSNLRRKIRNHLNSEFEGKCFYCQTKLDQGNAAFEIDHIVHKSKYIWFTYRPENLTLSCRLCNTSKSKKETLNSTLQTTKFKFIDYPQNSCDFSIIHAYIDNYDDHIKLEEDLFYKAKDIKGAKTIEICSLHRLKLAEDKAKALLIKKQERKQASIGLRQSFSKSFDSGTKEQIENIINETLKTLSDETDYLTRLISVTNNTEISDLGKILEKLEVNLINQRDINRLNYLLKYFDLLKVHIDLLYAIEDSKSIKKSIINYLRDTGVTGYDLSTPFLFTRDTFQTIKLASNNDLKIDRRVRTKFIDLINIAPDSEIDFCRLDYFFKHAPILLNISRTIKKILSNNSFMLSYGELSPTLITETKNDLHLLGNKVSHNPQLHSLSKLDIIHKNIHKYDVDSINNLYIVLNKSVKLLDSCKP
ncbi:hypothetical protein ASG97_05450 [Bacillus sp. Soil745]|nr:hypothetical protein ASG97_05450 [Bacillus sp. Soil745]